MGDGVCMKLVFVKNKIQFFIQQQMFRCSQLLTAVTNHKAVVVEKRKRMYSLKKKIVHRKI